MPRSVPLTTLLSWTWIAHTIEADNAAEAVGAERVGHHTPISLAMWANGLRFIDDEGVTVDELRTQAHAGCNIGGLERWGWISVGDRRETRRDGYGTSRGVKGDTVLRPTRAGRYARGVWPRVVRGVEERWRTRFGGGVIDVLSEALVATLTPTPWSPPEVNPSDGFYTHTIHERRGCDAERPLAALLGQALTAYTLDHERDAEVSLPLGANLLRVMGSATVRLRDLPALTGLSKEGIAMAASYLQRRHLATVTGPRCIGLTPRGLDALDGYWYRAAQLSDDGLRGPLEAVVAQREELSAGLVPPNGGWRGQKPYLARTQRVLADPTGALPWHPMILHRGGWPDAS